MKPTIFVSYCHDDLTPDHGRMRVLLDQLGKVGGENFELLVDYRHHGAAIGSNIADFMERVDGSDAVILLLTPGYKERVAQKGRSGVYTEFRRIYDRYLAATEKGSYGRTFLILPIIFTNTYSESCPAEIKNVVCVDATWLHVIPDKDPPRLRRDIATRLSALVREINGRLAGVIATKQREYLTRQEALLRHFLFDDSKSRWDKPENRDYLESAFVKTSTFLRARNRELSFVVGRKGAGKSTITHVLPFLQSPRPAHTLRLEFETLPFDACFNILLDKSAEASDLRHLFGPLHSYQLIWDGFLHLAFANAVKEQLPKQSDLRRLLRRLVDLPLNLIREEAERTAMVTRILFVFAFEKIISYISLVVRRPSGGGGIAESVAEFHPTMVRRQILGYGGLERLEAILEAYSQSGRRLLVTADGFDSMVEYFSLGSDRLVEARRFEREVLLALFQIVLNRGPARIGGGRLYDVSDFCIAVPHDRFKQTRAFDRDDYQYRNRVAPIAWSGIELSSLARKRLAYLRQQPDPKGPTLEERLAFLMARGYPELPAEIAFQFGAANYRMALFLYILRHTLWRPRDVLYYYASLLAASEEFGRKRSTTDTSFVRQVIGGATQHIVKDEIIGEYAAAFRNLNEVLWRFRQSSQVHTWDSLAAILDQCRFETEFGKSENPTTEWKVEVLYELGLLGAVLNRKQAERYSSHRHAFSFNEHRLLPDKLGRDNYRGCHFALHPVLCEYLNLDTAKNNELILALDWEYLHKNEVLQRLTPV
jgi:hypothetical protein